MTVQSLIDRARLEGKWLYCAYQDLWFSPDELEKELGEGRFRWGAANFTLLDPMDRVAELKQAVETAKTTRDGFMRRLGLK